MRFVIIIPVLLKRGTQAKFKLIQQQVVKLFPEAILAPLLNGKSKSELEKIAQKLAASQVEPLVIAEKNLFNVLLNGYQEVVKKYPKQLMVRMDISEHPISAVGDLIAEVKKNKGMVVGDLSFTCRTMKVFSLDWFMHKFIFPDMYHLFTKGKLDLSCAHGFQAFYNDKVLAKVLQGAQDIVFQIKKDKRFHPKWGFDGAMALAAAGLKVPVDKIEIKAIELRKRSYEKILRQYFDNRKICQAASKVFGSL